MRHIQFESRGEFDNAIESGWHYRSHIEWDEAVFDSILHDLDESLEVYGLEIVIGHSVQDRGRWVYTVEPINSNKRG